MSEINLIVQSDGRLRPSLQADLDIIRKYKPGMIIKAKVSRRRNPAHHRLYWATLGAILEHTDCLDTDDLHEDIKKELRMIESYRVDRWARVIIKTKSIDFGSMDQNEFDKFFKRAMDALLTHYLPGWTQDDIKKALKERGEL